MRSVLSAGRVPGRVPGCFSQAQVPALPARLTEAESHAEIGDVNGRTLLTCSATSGWTPCPGAGVEPSSPASASSERAVETTRDLAVRTGVTTARFVAADVYDASQALDRQTFNIVYTGMGALCWLPDLTRWAQVAASLVAPGGFLYLAE